MKSKLIIIACMAIINAVLLKAMDTFDNKDNSLFIYGTVTTLDNESYTGQIRWGTEEAFWFDFFNSTKLKNENLKYLSDEELASLDDRDRNNHASWNWNWWGDDNMDNPHNHVFACRFGDIHALEIGGDEDVKVKLKNGDVIEVEGGSNDIGAVIHVHDHDIGTIELNWKRVDKVEFEAMPTGYEPAFGMPLYGTVSTEEGDFEGYIQWDHDERLSPDKLNGENEDGELAIEFGKIKTISKYHNGAKVTLHSGRSFILKGTNDVNRENRGIIVNMPDLGRVDISWDKFKKVQFAGNVQGYEGGYASFAGEQKIRAIVETANGEKITGDIAYDLDERYMLEVLNGIQHGIEYFIPFGLVREISPANREETKVILKSGNTLLLEGKVDVNEENDGILVFEESGKSRYISWSGVKRISFL